MNYGRRSDGFRKGGSASQEEIEKLGGYQRYLESSYASKDTYQGLSHIVEYWLAKYDGDGAKFCREQPEMYRRYCREVAIPVGSKIVESD